MTRNNIITSILLIVFAVSISAIEALSFKYGGSFSFIASKLWISIGIIYLFFSLLLFLKQFFANLLKKHFFCLFAILIACLFIVIKAFSFQYVNHEATQQTAAAFENIKERDLNYTKSSFFGYPSRQYLITAAPSFLFGKNAFSINIGYAFPYLLGIAILYTGLQRTLIKNSHKDILTAITLVSVPTSPYAAEFLLRFEQSSLPLSFTLQAIGWYLIFLKDKSYISLVCLGWIVSLLSATYTPGLGSWVLFTFLLGTLLYKFIREQKTSHAIKVACVLIIILTFGINSVIGRNDLYLKNEISKSLNSQEPKLIEGYRIFFLSNPKSFLGPVIYLPVLLFLLTSVVGLNEFVYLAVSLWSIIVVGVSVFLKGYANPPPDFSIHRAMIVIPVLITFATMKIDGLIEQKQVVVNKLVLYVIFIFTATVSIFNFLSYINHVEVEQTDLRTYLIEDIYRQISKSSLNPDKKIEIIVFSDKDNFSSTADFLRYFYPNSNFTLSQNCNINLPPTQDAFVYFDHDICLQNLLAKPIIILPEKFRYPYANSISEMTKALVKASDY